MLSRRITFAMNGYDVQDLVWLGCEWVGVWWDVLSLYIFQVQNKWQIEARGEDIFGVALCNIVHNLL